MNIYYPSVETGASMERRNRHAAIQEFIEGKGLTIVRRPSAAATPGLGWLRSVDGVIAERMIFTSQLDRECIRAGEIGKEVLILLDRTTNPGAKVREPSERLRSLARSMDNVDSSITIVRSERPAKPMHELTYVQSAINVFLLSQLQWQQNVPTILTALPQAPASVDL